MTHGCQYFSHATAAQLWQLPLPTFLKSDPRLHVTNRVGRARIRRGVVAHEVSGKRVVRVHNRLPVSAPADAWCEFAVFGAAAGRGHARLNFGTSPEVLTEARTRLTEARDK